MHLGNAIIIRLCQALVTNVVVAELDFSYCDLGDECAESLCELIKSNSTLEALTLMGNHLSDNAVSAIARSLRHSKSLVSLNLSSNPFGDVGVIELGRVLGRGPCLKELVLLDCAMTCDGAVTFAESILVNQTLLFLTLPYHIGYDLINQIQRILKRNWDALHQEVALSLEAEAGENAIQEVSFMPVAPAKSWSDRVKPFELDRSVKNPMNSAHIRRQLGRDQTITSAMVCLALLEKKSAMRKKT
eukprot:PhF_6_TR3296/c0_g1_i1/m.4640